MKLENLTWQLKRLIITEAEKEETLSAEQLTDDEPLFGPESRLMLDSLDALQICVALKEQFGVRLQGDREVRKHMMCVANLCDYVQQQINE